jgi:hypothetical protein
MADTPADQAHPNPHLHLEETGTKHGVPAGVVEEDSKGLPHSDRQATESAPIHPDKAARD